MSEALYAKTISILAIVAVFLFFVAIILQILTNHISLIESIRSIFSGGRPNLLSEIDSLGVIILGLTGPLALLLISPRILKTLPIRVLVIIYIIIVVLSAIGIVKA